jgi:putative phosphoesterase
VTPQRAAPVLLAILSDTHLPRGGRSIPERCLEHCRAADAILHAGDFTGLEVLDELRALGPPVHGVRGNNETPALAAQLPVRLELEFAGVRVGMIHQPGPASGRLDALQALFPGCDAVVFGHTHMPELARGERFQIFNPGSPTERRRHTPAHTMGLARVSERQISFELATVD